MTAKILCTTKTVLRCVADSDSVLCEDILLPQLPRRRLYSCDHSSALGKSGRHSHTCQAHTSHVRKDVTRPSPLPPVTVQREPLLLIIV